MQPPLNPYAREGEVREGEVREGWVGRGEGRTHAGAGEARSRIVVSWRGGHAPVLKEERVETERERESGLEGKRAWSTRAGEGKVRAVQVHERAVCERGKSEKRALREGEARVVPDHRCARGGQCVIRGTTREGASREKW